MIERVEVIFRRDQKSRRYVSKLTQFTKLRLFANNNDFEYKKLDKSTVKFCVSEKLPTVMETTDIRRIR